MRRLQLNFNEIRPHRHVFDAEMQLHRQGFNIEFTDLRDLAIKIREDLNLKRCTKILDTYIFTEIEQ